MRILLSSLMLLGGLNIILARSVLWAPRYSQVDSMDSFWSNYDNDYDLFGSPTKQHNDENKSLMEILFGKNLDESQEDNEEVSLAVLTDVAKSSEETKYDIISEKDIDELAGILDALAVLDNIEKVIGDTNDKEYNKHEDDGDDDGDAKQVKEMFNFLEMFGEALEAELGNTKDSDEKTTNYDANHNAKDDDQNEDDDDTDDNDKNDDDDKYKNIADANDNNDDDTNNNYDVIVSDNNNDDDDDNKNDNNDDDDDNEKDKNYDDNKNNNDDDDENNHGNDDENDTDDDNKNSNENDDNDVTNNNIENEHFSWILPNVDDDLKQNRKDMYEIIQTTTSPFISEFQASSASDYNGVQEYVAIRRDLDILNDAMHEKEHNLDKDFYSVVADAYNGESVNKFENDLDVIYENLNRIKRNIDAIQNLKSKVYFNKLVKAAVKEIRQKSMEEKF